MTMGIMAYSLIWVMRDLYHQPYFGAGSPTGGAHHINPISQCTQQPLAAVEGTDAACKKTIHQVKV